MKPLISITSRRHEVSADWRRTHTPLNRLERLNWLHCLNWLRRLVVEVNLAMARPRSSATCDWVGIYMIVFQRYLWFRSIGLLMFDIIGTFIDIRAAVGNCGKRNRIINYLPGLILLLKCNMLSLWKSLCCCLMLAYESISRKFVDQSISVGSIKNFVWISLFHDLSSFCFYFSSRF